MANKPTSIPRWAANVSVVEPSLGKKNVGWLNGERPASAMWNWLQRNLSEWVMWLQVGSSRVLPWFQSTAIANTQGSYTSIAMLDTVASYTVMAISTIASVLAVRISTNAGLTWTVTTAPGGIGQSIAANSTRFVMVGSSGKIQTYEGGAWTSRTAAAGFTGQFYQVIWTGTMFVAVGDLEVQTSLDGITWTRRASSAPTGGPNTVVALPSVAAAGGRLVRVGKGSRPGGSPSGEVWYSDDGGTTWTYAYSDTQAYLTGVVGTVFADGTIGFAAAGESRGVYSQGGAVWSDSSALGSFGGGVGAYSYVTGISAWNDLLLADSGRYMTPDGVNWYAMPFAYADNTSSVATVVVSRAGFALVVRPYAGGGAVVHELARTAPQRWF